LSVQLIAIVVVTVASILALSQWLATRLSERALESDSRERALLMLRTVDSLWGRTDPQDLGRMLATIVEGDREITALDIFQFRGRTAEIALSTRKDEEKSDALLNADQVQRLISNAIVTVPVSDANGNGGWRWAVPLERQGRVEGAVQVEVSLAEMARLNRWLRITAGILLIGSIALTSLILAIFLERRVAWPVAALVDGMQRAESGELGARVAVPGHGEFAFLARSFNSMLSRIEDLTAGLEGRVRQATRDLDDKNRELQAANAKLWQAQLEVGRSERLATLGQMAATIAHELGTPLNSVLGYTQLLRRDHPSAEQAEKLTIVESQVLRMIETIRSVLDRTRDRTLRREPDTMSTLT